MLPSFPWPCCCSREEIGLTPWFLGSLYARLDECSRNVTQSIGRYVSYVDANFLQLFLFERIQSLTLEPQVFKAPQPQIVDGIERVKFSQLASRARRWHGQPKEEKRPYSFTCRGVLPTALYSLKIGRVEIFKGEIVIAGRAQDAACSADPDNAPFEVQEWGSDDDLQPPATTAPIWLRPRDGASVGEYLY